MFNMQRCCNFTLNVRPLFVTNCYHLLFFSCENETKMLLLLGKLLDLVSRQFYFTTDKNIHIHCTEVLCNAVGKLSQLSEDKASAGLLGAIGLGKKSALSVRYVRRYRIIVILTNS